MLDNKLINDYGDVSEYHIVFILTKIGHYRTICVDFFISTVSLHPSVSVLYFSEAEKQTV